MDCLNFKNLISFLFIDEVTFNFVISSPSPKRYIFTLILFKILIMFFKKNIGSLLSTNLPMKKIFSFFLLIYFVGFYEKNYLCVHFLR